MFTFEQLNTITIGHPYPHFLAEWKSQQLSLELLFINNPLHLRCTLYERC